MSKYAKISAKDKRKAKKGGKMKIEQLIGKNETVLWKGKPKRAAYVLNKLPAILFDLIILSAIVAASCYVFFLFFKEGENQGNYLFLGASGIVALIFLGLYIGIFWKFISAFGYWKGTEYAVTDKRIIINSGFIELDYRSIFYKEIANVKLHRGFLDRICGVGDIDFAYISPALKAEYRYDTYDFTDISDYDEVYSMLKQAIVDIQTDIEFPNALRPPKDSVNTASN